MDAEETALREAVFAAPDDDAPRKVYADWLLERGRTHGACRVAQLTKKMPDHNPEPSPLKAVPGRVSTWARGFPNQFTFGPVRGSVRAEAWAALPEWATVEHLRFVEMKEAAVRFFAALVKHRR